MYVHVCHTYISSIHVVLEKQQSRRLKVGSQYDVCASVMTGSAVETNGRMYACVRLKKISILTYAYMLPFVSTALPVVTLAHASY